MKTICLVSQKGGVCKTTTAEALIYGLRNKGFRVLALDLDQSANLTKNFIGDNFEHDVFDLVSGKRTCSEVIKEDLIPGGNGLVYLSQFYESHDYTVLKQKIKEVEDKYDYFIIDTPPTMSKVILSALAISDYSIIPAEPSQDCIDGCLSTMEIIDLVKSRFNANLTNLGILLVKYKERYNAHSAIKELLNKKNIKTFKTTIRESQAINNAKLLHKSFFAKEYNTAKAVIDYHTFVREVMSVIS